MSKQPERREARPAPGAGPSDDDEPTQDSLEWHWDRFASSIANATDIAVRNTRATEVVLVAPPPMLVLLRRRVSGLLPLGVKPVVVPMDASLLVSAGSRSHATGAGAAPGYVSARAC